MCCLRGLPPDAIPASVERLLLVAHIASGVGCGTTFRDFETLTVQLGPHHFRLDLANRGEAALILVEIYRRGAEWRLSASGQGFVSGVAALNSALGIDLPVPVPARDERPWGHGRDDDHRPPPGSTFSGSGFAVDDQHVLVGRGHVEDAVFQRLAVLGMDRRIVAVRGQQRRQDARIGADVQRDQHRGWKAPGQAGAEGKQRGDAPSRSAEDDEPARLHDVA